MALFAMLLQVLFTAEHYSALAAAITGQSGNSGGFLQICTPQGLAVIADPGQNGSGEEVPITGSGPACAICGSVATSGAIDLPEFVALPAPAEDWPAVTLSVEQQVLLSRYSYHLPAPRGPPAV